MSAISEKYKIMEQYRQELTLLPHIYDSINRLFS